MDLTVRSSWYESNNTDTYDGAIPSEEFELTANTLQAHMKPHGKLILKPLIYLTVHSRDDLTPVTFL